MRYQQRPRQRPPVKHPGRVAAFKLGVYGLTVGAFLCASACSDDSEAQAPRNTAASTSIGTGATTSPPPATVDPFIHEGPLGTALQVFYSGDMVIRVAESDAPAASVIPGGGPVLVFDVSVTQVTRQPVFHDDHLALVTSDGEHIHPAEDPRFPNATPAPGQTLSGPITFAVPSAGQEPEKIVYMTENGMVQAEWTL